MGLEQLEPYRGDDPPTTVTVHIDLLDNLYYLARIDRVLPLLDRD